MRPAARPDDLPHVQLAVLDDAVDGLVPAALAPQEDVERLLQLPGSRSGSPSELVDEPIENLAERREREGTAPAAGALRGSLRICRNRCIGVHHLSYSIIGSFERRVKCGGRFG